MCCVRADADAGEKTAAGADGADDDDDLHRVRAVFYNREWIWVGNRFVSAAVVAFRCPPNAEPYLHPVPQELLRFSALLKAVGVQARVPVATAVEYSRALWHE